MGVCNCSLFCCTLLYIHSSISIILMGKKELITLLNLSSWCLVTVDRLFLTVSRGCLRFVIVVFPGHTHLLFLVAVFIELKYRGLQNPCSLLVGKPNFSDQFKKIVKRYIKVGYNLDVM